MANPYTSFVGRDYTARFQAIITLLQAEVPGLTDLNYSGIANVFCRLLASESDYGAFYQDEAYEETSLSYAKFKQSLVDLATTVDQLPLLASSAQDLLTVTWAAGVTPVDTHIPIYSQCYRGDGLSYLTTVATTFYATQTSIQIPIIQGTLVTLTPSYTDFTASDMTGRLTYDLGPNVCAGSVSVSHGTAPVVQWTQVDSFWQSQPTDYHFLLVLVPDGPNGETDAVALTLGNGTQGCQQFIGPMTVTFVRTDGANGNCGPGVVTNPPSSLTGIISITNAAPLRGGGSAEGTESLRARIPAATHIQRRAVSDADYTPLIMTYVPGILDVQAADRTTLPTMPYLYDAIYVVPQGGPPLSSLMKSQILSVCQQRGRLGDWEGRYLVLDPTLTPVNVGVTIGIANGYDPSPVVSAVTAIIQSTLAVPNQVINGTLSYGNLFTSVSNTPGVRYANFATPIADMNAGIGELFVPGVITVTVGP